MDSNTLDPLVTIVLPTFERAKYLREAIDSALAQTYENFVLFIGDNSATDDTEAVVREYDDPRIKYVRHAQNRGQQGNWLWLIENAETPYVASLHDDDVWQPDFLSETVPMIDADPTVAMVFADYELMDGESQAMPELSDSLTHRSHRDVLPAGRVELSYADTLRLVAVWNAPQPAFCAVLRRSSVMATEFPDEIDPVYDLWLSYQIARRGERFAYVPKRLTRYRWHSGSSTAAGWYKPEDEIFSRIIAENSGEAAVVSEIKDYWATIRWGRAVRMMASPGTMTQSRAEFSAVTPSLKGPKRVIGSLAARSEIAWRGLRLARVAVQKLGRTATE